VSVQEHWLEGCTPQWFYRQALPAIAASQPPVLLLHGLPSQSYGWRQVLDALAKQGFRAIAPDWIGFGFSDAPDRRDFAYTPEAYCKALEDFVQQLELESFHLVVQGFVGSVGLQYALRHPERIQRLVILNTPLSTAAKVPWRIRQLGLPLIGDMLTQDPLLVDRTLEGGGLYRVEDEDLDVYRRPFLRSSDAGRSLLAAVRNLQMPTAMAEIEAGFQTWEKPVLVAWGGDDPWLSVDLAERFVSHCPGAELTRLEKVGHYPQQDWHEKVTEAITTFFRRTVL
jgi:pimeloyl-ACP methyl ester carboxylesterase